MNEPNLKDVEERHRTMVMQAKGVVGIAVGWKADPRKAAFNT
jgi:hypothetical protein